MALPGTREPSSRTDHLEKVVLHLETRGDRRAIIQLVERWIASGSPPKTVRLAQARAFLDLGLMDRAWLRLKEITEQEPDDIEAQILTARMFVERGWPTRARRLLQSALEREPHRRDVQELLARAHEPPLQPPPNARDIERSGSVDEQLALAERFLAAGSQLRAKSILERLRRGKGTTAARAEELLWGLGGDFSAGPSDPLLLARELLPPGQLDAPDGSVIDLNEDELEVDEVTSHGQVLGADLGHHDPESFPSLFRKLPEELNLHDFTDGEVTSITRMADPEQLRRAELSEDTDPGFAEDDGDEGDTQVMMVIPQSRSFREQIALERGEGQQDSGRETRNLREVGMTGGAVRFEPLEGELELEDSELEYGDDLPLGRLGGDLDDEDDDLLEEEDEDLIVMTRSEPSLLPELGAAQVPEPAPELEVLEVNPPPRDPSAPEPRPPSTPISRYLAEPSVDDFRSPLQRMAPALLLLALVLAAGGYLSYRGQQAIWSASIYSEVSDALDRASYRELLSAEGRLEQIVASGTDDLLPAHLAGLALVKLQLWGEYTGGPTRLQVAEDLLERARAMDSRDKLLALTEGWRLFLLGDYSAAHSLAVTLDASDPEVLLLRARIAVSLGDGDEALELIDRALELSSSPRFQLQRARICLESGADCAAEAVAQVVAALPDEPAVRLMALELTCATEDRSSALPAVEAFIAGLDDSVPPRVAGRAYFLQYTLLRSEDPEAAATAMELAVAKDPTNPVYLYHHAADFLARGAVRSALKSLGECIDARPADWRYRAAQIWTLLEMDRVEEADAALEALPEELKTNLRYKVARAAVALIGHEQPEEALRLLDDPALVGDAEAEYLRGLARGRLGEDSSATLLRASEQLASLEEPMLQLLAPRARAAALLFGDPAQPYLLEETAALARSTDPMVHLTLAELWERRGDRRRAAAHFDKAVTLGEDPAIAHYLRGQFYIDARDNLATTTDAWRTYLKQHPSGSRAQRVRQRLER